MILIWIYMLSDKRNKLFPSILSAYNILSQMDNMYVTLLKDSVQNDDGHLKFM